MDTADKKSILLIRTPDEKRFDRNDADETVEKTELCTNDIKAACELRLTGRVFDEIKTRGVFPDDDIQDLLYKLLKPSGKLLIEGIVDRSAGQALSVDLQIHGFLDIMAAKDPLTGERFVVCQKPAWEAGAAAVLSTKATKESSSESKSQNGGKWKMDVDDLAEDDLVDESELLNQDGADIPEESKGSGCGEVVNGKRRACKNCSCGLADMDDEEAAKVAQESKNATVEDKIIKSSACGNCYRGDAFRCASCPFKGKPAFEPGNERVILSMTEDDI